MGNSIKSEVQFDPEGPGDNVTFFQNMNIRWLNVFINRIKDAKKGEFAIQNANETLKWSDYFRIFTEIKDNMVSEVVVKERKIWHPATIGYAMTKKTAEALLQEANEVVEPGPISNIVLPPDDYTDDDPSEFGGEGVEDVVNVGGGHSLLRIQGSETNVGKKKLKGSDEVPPKSKPKGWDSNYTNPIYFGYTLQSVGDRDKEISKEKSDLKARENRALERARTTRSVAIDALEKSCLAQGKARADKINKLEEKYLANKKKKDEELARNKRELLDMAFNIYEVSYVGLIYSQRLLKYLAWFPSLLYICLLVTQVRTIPITN